MHAIQSKGQRIQNIGIGWRRELHDSTSKTRQHISNEEFLDEVEGYLDERRRRCWYMDSGDHPIYRTRRLCS